MPGRFRRRRGRCGWKQVLFARLAGIEAGRARAFRQPEDPILLRENWDDEQLLDDDLAQSGSAG
jgi:hypothetical protein